MADLGKAVIYSKDESCYELEFEVRIYEGESHSDMRGDVEKLYAVTKDGEPIIGAELEAFPGSIAERGILNWEYDMAVAEAVGNAVYNFRSNR